MELNFKDYLNEKYKNPLNRHHMKGSRGITRKSQRWVPKTHTKLRRGDYHSHDLGFARKPLDIAKAADSGIWRISKEEADELADFYQMHVPGPHKRAKQLGKTKIILWRKKPGEFYLVKPPKEKRDRYKKKE